MTFSSAYETALDRAVEKLKGADLAARCPNLGLPLPRGNTLEFNLFGTAVTLELTDFQLFEGISGRPVNLFERILVLHYLACDLPLEPGGELISFRRLPGGQFYWSAFVGRSIRPLLQLVGNRLEVLQKSLDAVPWQPVSYGDLGARIHVMGKMYITLIYHLGDGELPPAADYLFDPCAQRVYGAEDVAVLAGRTTRRLVEPGTAG